MQTRHRPLVLIESPFHHPHEQGKRMHQAYLELCLYDSIHRNEVPIATHKLYTMCLDDDDPIQRSLGMETLVELMERTDFHALYYDLGISKGMRKGIILAKKFGKPLVKRSLYGHPEPSDEMILQGMVG